jgi:hypothetical protein
MKTVNLKIATKWKELKPKQLKYIASLHNLECTENEYLTYAFLHLAGLKVASGEMRYDNYEGIGFQWFKTKGEKPFILNTKQISIHLESVRFLLNIDETNPPKWIRFCKPCNYRLFKTKLRQYLTIENFYQAYDHTKDEKYLDKFIASIYKHPWQRFKDDKINKRARKFRSVSKDTKIAVFLFYGGVRVFLKKQYSALFDSNSDNSNEKPDMRQLFRNVLRTLNKGDVTRNEAIFNSDTHDALSELEASVIEVEKIKKQRKHV